ncbi:hypothetical protein L1281_000076 [Neisseria sp. HSC-16F19]|nr:NAD(P)-binding protein [Neisseria sp. HSC-16F19]MCP2039511.1 hypothetical protein [Neisseria sp. HSC-16F19]
MSFRPTRRQLLGHAAGLAVCAAIPWYAHTRWRPPPPTLSVRRMGLPLGHQLRDRTLPAPVAEWQADTLILGSGAAALSALWWLTRHGHHNILLAQGPEPHGNNAAYHYDGGLAAPSGAHYLALPSRESVHVRQLLADLGILQGDPAAAQPAYRETDLVHAPMERLWYQGQWQHGIAPPEEDADSRRFAAFIHEQAQAVGRDGKKRFAIPLELSSNDAEWRALDQESFADWLARHDYRSSGLLWYLDYCCRDDYGIGLAQTSAWAGLHYFAARNNDSEAVLTWPDGLAHLSRAIESLCGLVHVNTPDTRRQPQAVAASALAIDEQPDHVRVDLYLPAAGHSVRVRARRVIAAMPLNIAARIIARPQDYGLDPAALPPQSPWLVSNFVLRAFPREADNFPLAWDNVAYQGAGLGYVAAANQFINTAKPPRTIFTAYTALNHAPPAEVRRWLMDAPDAALLETAAAELVAIYGPHFWQHVIHTDIAVRAHAMAAPVPGFLANPVLESLRRHRSRLVFAHSDMSGYSVFEEACWQGVRAAEKIMVAD